MTFGEIVDEIVRFTGLPRQEVERRVWMEALELGWNVARDVARFRVTPHHYDEKMFRLYREGDGFIFETMVFWTRPDRQRWSRHALERMRLHARKVGLEPHGLRVLVLGDGTGNDSLFLATNGFRVDYFEIPESKTFDFATSRFEHYGLLGQRINVRTDYGPLLAQQYDAVISFEVLEHLSQPLTAIHDIRSMLRTGGIALVTEAFGLISEHLPTHLEANARYTPTLRRIHRWNRFCRSWHFIEPGPLLLL